MSDQSASLSEVEVWKPIVGYEGLYEVSSHGRVRNPNRGNRIKNNHITERGYHRTWLSKNGKGRNARVHRLVAEAFIPNPENKLEINHKDFNKLNNHISNLEWTTGEENISHYRKCLVR